MVHRMRKQDISVAFVALCLGACMKRQEPSCYPAPVTSPTCAKFYAELADTSENAGKQRQYRTWSCLAGEASQCALVGKEPPPGPSTAESKGAGRAATAPEPHRPTETHPSQPETTTAERRSDSKPAMQKPTLSGLCNNGDHEACDLRRELNRNGMKGRLVDEMGAASLLRRRAQNLQKAVLPERLGTEPVAPVEWGRRCSDGDGTACAVLGWINGCSSGVAADCTKAGLAYNHGASNGKDIPMVPDEALRFFKRACRLDPVGDECWVNGLILAKGEEFCPTDADIEWFLAQACQKAPRRHCAGAAYVYEHTYTSLPCIERTNLFEREKRYNRKACSAGDGAACEKLESK